MLILNVILAVVALGALLVAWLSRREADSVRRDLEQLAQTAQTNFERLDKATAERLDALNRRVNAIEGGARPAPAANGPRSPKSVFLPRPDVNGCFGPGSDTEQAGNSLFVLTSDDGLHGTYTVIDRREVHRFALMMPGENLTVACRGEGIQQSAGMTRVVTDQPGTALLRGGNWFVETPALIHYQ